MATHAAIFPGQGAQFVGMGRDVAAAHPAAAEVFRIADHVLGFPLSELCFNGPAERLEATDVQQPAVFVTSVAVYRAAVACGRITPEQFVALGGLSLGEYTALHIGGALPFEDALRVVQRRGQLMQEAADRTPGGMVSLLGLDEAQVLALCERVAPHGQVRPANYNCPGQIVISGDRPACEAAAALAEEFGGRAVPLKVAGAFHSPHMQPAADGLRPVLATAAFGPPTVRVIANVDARYHGEPDAIRMSLVQQVTSPVRWQACVERLIADGVTEFYEIGPNRHLAGMLRKIDRRLKVTNLGTADDLTAAA